MIRFRNRSQLVYPLAFFLTHLMIAFCFLWSRWSSFSPEVSFNLYLHLCNILVSKRWRNWWFLFSISSMSWQIFENSEIELSLSVYAFHCGNTDLRQITIQFLDCMEMINDHDRIGKCFLTYGVIRVIHIKTAHLDFWP